MPFFLLVRVVLPWKEWGELGGSVLLFALRPPAAPAARGDGPRPAARLRVRNAVFVGWFGPIGVSAVFYLAFSADERAKDPRWLPAGMAVVAVSTVLHGVTAIPGRTLYARSRSPASPSLCPDARDNGRMWRMTTIDGVRSGQACERVRP